MKHPVQNRIKRSEISVRWVVLVPGGVFDLPYLDIQRAIETTLCTVINSGGNRSTYELFPSEGTATVHAYMKMSECTVRHAQIIHSNDPRLHVAFLVR
jgi:hypothetical protein